VFGQLHNGPVAAPEWTITTLLPLTRVVLGKDSTTLLSRELELKPVSKTVQALPLCWERNKEEDAARTSARKLPGFARYVRTCTCTRYVSHLHVHVVCSAIMNSHDIAIERHEEREGIITNKRRRSNKK